MCWRNNVNLFTIYRTTYMIISVNFTDHSFMWIKNQRGEGELKNYIYIFLYFSHFTTFIFLQLVQDFYCTKPSKHSELRGVISHLYSQIYGMKINSEITQVPQW